MSLLSWLKKNTARDDAWITVHPNAGGKGSPVLLDDEGYIKGGMGGKFTGQRIDLIPRKNNSAPSSTGQISVPKSSRYSLAQPQKNNAVVFKELTTAQKEKVAEETKRFNKGLQESIKRLKKQGRFTPEVEQRIKAAKKEFADLSNKIESRADLSEEDKERMKDFLNWHCENAAVHPVSSPETGSDQFIYHSQEKMLKDAINGTLPPLSPTSLSGASKGAEMPVEDADKNNANPGYLTHEDGCYTNCQTCILAYEARRRGYDVEATLRTAGSFNSALARQYRSIFFDPKTGLAPIRNDMGKSADEGYKYLTQKLKEGERYVISLTWAEVGGNHVENVELRDGNPCIIDAQSGKVYQGDSLKEHLTQMSWDRGDEPQIMRVDNVGLNKDICEKVLKSKR